MRIIVAIGGNMISDASNKNETFQDQLKRISNTANLLTKIIERGHEIVITHGNGPQVGSLLLQQQADVDGATNLPLYILGALTQGQIGVLLQHAILNEFNRKNIDKKVYVLPTSVIVDKDDPGFKNPSKPIGPSYNNTDNLPKEYVYKNTPKGYRRVVPSPKPLEILEIDLISKISNNKDVVIAVGGGGNPTIKTENGLQLIDAVIDKDLASALLAKKLNADLFIILTDVEGVFENYKTPQQKLIRNMSIDKAKKLIADPTWGAGNMAPKIKACIEFAEINEAIITSPNNVLDAIDGKAGTHIRYK